MGCVYTGVQILLTVLGMDTTEVASDLIPMAIIYFWVPMAAVRSEVNRDGKLESEKNILL